MRNIAFSGFPTLAPLLLCLAMTAGCGGSAGGDSSGGFPLYNAWEITAPTPLLDENGLLAAWGFIPRGR